MYWSVNASIPIDYITSYKIISTFSYNMNICRLLQLMYTWFLQILLNSKHSSYLRRTTPLYWQYLYIQYTGYCITLVQKMLTEFECNDMWKLIHFFAYITVSYCDIGKKKDYTQCTCIRYSSRSKSNWVLTTKIQLSLSTCIS